MAISYNIPSSSTDGEEQEGVPRNNLNEILKRINSEHAKLGIEMPAGPDPNNLTGCYDVGDIGPAGGIIVATPNSIGNNTQYYYELSPNDLHQNQNLLNMNCPGSVCPFPICEWGSTGVDFTTECLVGQGKNNTNNAGTPSNQYLNSLNAFTLCTQYSLGGYDDWFLPSKDEWGLVRNVASFLSSINITTFNDCEVPGGFQTDPCSLAGDTLVPYWSSSAADPSNINYSQCTPYANYSWSAPDNHKAIVCAISGDFKVMRHSDASVRAMRRFTCPYVIPGNVHLPCYDIGDITPQGGMIFAIPYTGWNNTKYYYEVGLTDLHTGGTPIDSTTWWGCDVSGSTVVGAEWGLYGNTGISTSIEFGDGYKNTILIDNFPTGPNNPYINTREIAATICLNYGVTQQHVLEEGEEWFLPSLYEMWYMYTTVGPGTAFGTTLNLSESQIGSLASGAMTNDGWYWTSSQYSALDADNPGQFNPGYNPVSFPGEENYAWSFINTSNLSPSQPPLSLQRRCHASSVRPVRRFECEDTSTQGGVDYNWRICEPIWNINAPSESTYGAPGFGMFQAKIPGGGWVHNKFGVGVPTAYGGNNPNYDQVSFKYNVLSAAGIPLLVPRPWWNQMLPHWPQIYFHSHSYAPDAWGNYNWSYPGYYTIKIYDIHENLMGHWEAKSSGGSGCGAHSYCQREKRLHDITLIQGPDDIVELTGDEYVLIEKKQTFSTNHRTNTLDLHNYASTGTSLRMIDQFTNLPIPGPVPYWKGCIECCANTSNVFAPVNSGCKKWGVAISPNQVSVFVPDPPWWTPPHGTGTVPWSAAPGTPGNPFSTIGALKQDCNQLTSLTSGGACGVTIPWWYAPFTWVNSASNTQSKISNPYSKEEEGLLAQDCSKDSSYFTERDNAGKHLTPGEQLNLISKKLNKFAKRIKNKFR